MRVQSYGLTHKGYVRQTNDDCYAELKSHNFYILADGIGSCKEGGLAARLAVQLLLDEVKKKPLFVSAEASIEELLEALEAAIVATHRLLWQRNKGGCGTTLVCLLFTQNYCLFAHVGDSRIYLLRNNQLKLLSHDDSLVFELLHYGLIEEDEAKHFPLRHIITKSLGGQSRLNIHCHSHPIEPDDLYMLCSDGLSGALDHQQLKEILLQYLDHPRQAALTLQEAALAAGGTDNITVLLAHVL